jgi:hypothetical protein
MWSNQLILFYFLGFDIVFLKHSKQLMWLSLIFISINYGALQPILHIITIEFLLKQELLPHSTSQSLNSKEV